MDETTPFDEIGEFTGRLSHKCVLNEECRQTKAWIPLNNLRNFGEIKTENLASNDCKHFVDLSRFAKDAVDYILDEITKEEDKKGTYRKRPLVISRFARGGKSTSLCAIFDLLAKSQTAYPLAINFNGSSNFSMLPGESQANAIFRLIVAQLQGTDSQIAQRCEPKTLDNFIGETPCVLLIDELNIVGNPLDVEASNLLKSLFLRKKNRMLAFTTHVPMTADYDVKNFMANLSNGGNFAISQPYSTDLAQLQMMHDTCSGLTAIEAAFYGYCPALIFSGKAHSIIASEKFRSSSPYRVDKVHSFDVVCDLIAELRTGDPRWGVQEIGNNKCAEHRRYYAFCSVSTDQSGSLRIRWPLCYLLEIFRTLPNLTKPGYSISSEAVANILDNLSSSGQQTNTGLDWELVVQAALMLQFADTVLNNAPLPLELGAPQHWPLHARHIKFPPRVHTLMEAKLFISELLQKTTGPTLFLITPAAGDLNVLDGFAVYTPGTDNMRGRPKNHAGWRPGIVVHGFQCNAGREIPTKAAPPMTHKSFLVRGKPAMEHSLMRNWECLSRKQTMKLLGWSLEPFMPAELCAL